jgi:hypothetical protein
MPMKKKKEDVIKKLDKTITQRKIVLSKFSREEKPVEYRKALKKLKRAQRRLAVSRAREARAAEPKKKKQKEG